MFDPSKYYFLVSDSGGDQIAAELRRLREKHGDDFLNRFKKDFPDLTIIIDLCANYDDETAFSEFKKYVFDQIENLESVWERMLIAQTAHKFIDQNKPALFALHGKIRAEIDKPRF